MGCRFGGGGVIRNFYIDDHLEVHYLICLKELGTVDSL